MEFEKPNYDTDEQAIETIVDGYPDELTRNAVRGMYQSYRMMDPEAQPVDIALKTLTHVLDVLEGAQKAAKE